MAGAAHGVFPVSCEDWEMGLWVPYEDSLGSWELPFAQASAEADLGVPYGDCED